MKCDLFGWLFHTVKVSNCYSHHHDIITVKLLCEKFEYLPNRKVIQLLGHYANLVGWQKIWPSITNCNIGMLIMKVKLLKVYTETSWRFKSKLWTCCAVFPIWLAWLMRQAGDLNTLWLKLLTLLPSSRLYISSRAWLQMTFTIFFCIAGSPTVIFPQVLCPGCAHINQLFLLFPTHTSALCSPQKAW